MKILNPAGRSATFVALTLVAGCGPQPVAAPRIDAAQSTAAPAESAAPAKAAHAHDEWWCGEHGVPEEICGQCNSKLAAAFQKKGDWCKDHDRPDSQCFICHPEYEKNFADQYVAKFGKQPMKPE